MFEFEPLWSLVHLFFRHGWIDVQQTLRFIEKIHSMHVQSMTDEFHCFSCLFLISLQLHLHIQLNICPSSLYSACSPWQCSDTLFCAHCFNKILYFGDINHSGLIQLVWSSQCISACWRPRRFWIGISDLLIIVRFCKMVKNWRKIWKDL